MGVRAGILFVFGALIAFTANLHDLVFSTNTLAIALIAVAVINFAAAAVLTKRLPNTPLIVHFVAGGLAGAALLVMNPSLQVLSLVATIWAALTAAADVWAGWIDPNKAHGRELKTAGVLAGLLTLLLLLVPATPVSILGLFGGYCFVVGVFLAIAAYDPKLSVKKESEDDR